MCLCSDEVQTREHRPRPKLIGMWRTRLYKARTLKECIDVSSNHVNCLLSVESGECARDCKSEEREDRALVSEFTPVRAQLHVRLGSVEHTLTHAHLTFSDASHAERVQHLGVSLSDREDF